MKKRILLWVLMNIILFGSVLIMPGGGTLISVSRVEIDATGYEDPSTHEWKGSFWVIAATTDTKESYLLFNKSLAEYFGQNKIGNNTIIPQATIKITITPRQPYWERPLKAKIYPVYPITYGTHIPYWNPQKPVSKILEDCVPKLVANVLQFDVDDPVWTLHTPFDVRIEKKGENPFTKTVRINTVGGVEKVVIANPADSSEKLMITDLGKIGTGYTAPPISSILVLNKTIPFLKTDELVKAIEYGRNSDTGEIIQHENYAFYWFGGGDDYKAPEGEVCAYDDDWSPAHYCWTGVIPHNSLVEDGDFPGSYRDPNDWGNSILPTPADILNDNPDTNPPGGLSLVNYLIDRIESKSIDSKLLDLKKFWGDRWTITSNNRLRIYMPSGAASSLITVKVSTEMADSVVYQPIVGHGTIEQCFWDSSKTTQCSIEDGDSDVAILKVKQSATESSKLTVTPYVPANVPVSVIPQKDSAIIDPESVHTFQFGVSSLGTDTKQNAIITFEVTNDVGTTTDSQTLEFELKPPEKEPENSEPDDTPDSGEPDGVPEPLDSGDPLFVVLVVIIVLTVITGTAYSLRTHLPSRRKQT